MHISEANLDGLIRTRTDLEDHSVIGRRILGAHRHLELVEHIVLRLLDIALRIGQAERHTTDLMIDAATECLNCNGILTIRRLHFTTVLINSDIGEIRTRRIGLKILRPWIRYEISSSIRKALSQIMIANTERLFIRFAIFDIRNCHPICRQNTETITIAILII